MHTAVRALDPKVYSAPASKPALTKELPAQDRSAPPVVPDLLPKDGNRFFAEPIAQSTVAKVNAIRDQALAIGWNESRLYQNHGRFRFPFGGDYGLVCFVADERHIGEVTNEHIEILVGPPSRESRWRFYNPDVAQPWMGRTLEENRCLSARVVKE
ncbi:MAG: hypothetical protein HYX72_14515 [Acidobacteria bacterium]|nr:hypothetical protein [Acidobacteriota bacterium]